MCELDDHYMAEAIDDTLMHRFASVLPNLPAGTIRDHVAEIIDNPGNAIGHMAVTGPLYPIAESVS